ncbi:MAG TPA: hypothetical protein VGR28_03155, partial [Candidatus Thermoplasmatota archaeon]|nr:hypothetical protein [Candidatus Thermoplasmatota archaeon]
MDVPLELAMKGATLAGVALGATGMVLARLPPPARVRCFVVTGAGVGLMLANALVAASPFALLLDGVFAAWAA